MLFALVSWNIFTSHEHERQQEECSKPSLLRERANLENPSRRHQDYRHLIAKLSKVRHGRRTGKNGSTGREVTAQKVTRSKVP